MDDKDEEEDEDDDSESDHDDEDEEDVDITNNFNQEDNINNIATWFSEHASLKMNELHATHPSTHGFHVSLSI